jgi:hypothetical protein
MPDVELTTEVRAAAPAVRGVLRPVLQVLSERSDEGELSLAVRLAPRDGAAIADVTVPVALTVGKTVGADEPIPLEVKAHGPGALFPAFSGSIEAHEEGPASSAVVLRGTYEPPLGLIGAAIDATVMHGTARASLSSLLERIASAVNARLGEDAERERRGARGM